MRTRMWIAGLLLIISTVSASAQEEGDKDEFAGRTPPRLGFIDGQVSFWRPGAEDWVQAQVNTALSPGDELYTGSPGNLELQVGPRAFVRGWANTQIGLVNQDPDYLQFKVTTGYASFDLRTLDPGHTVEVDTPNGAFTIEQAGYYRVDVAGERTAFITRRGGQAVVTPAGGQPMAIASNEEVVLTGTDHPEAASFAAPALDSWDRWNYARTERLLDSVSSRYVPPGSYGTDDLDYYGRWRVMPDYGPVWVPTGTPAGWAPYSTGSWVNDPYYGWTWVDAAPWGWAPYHYGRWVHVNGYWGWAPGPAVVRPVYAPACVAFFGGPHGSVSIGIGGGPVVGWVALGWGEPIVPWWGHHPHGPRPWWGGWGGPRVVNNVVVNRTTVVNVNQINVYRNAEVHNAVVAVHGDRFGHGPIQSARITQVNSREFSPVHGGPQVQASAAALVPNERRGTRPPEHTLNRQVVGTRAPQHLQQANTTPQRANPAVAPRAETRLVPAPDKNQAGGFSRAPFGQGGHERGPNQPAERSLPSGAAGRPADTRVGSVPGAQAPAPVTRTPDAGRRTPEPNAPTAGRPPGQTGANAPAPQQQGAATPPGQSSGERGPKVIESGRSPAAAGDAGKVAGPSGRDERTGAVPGGQGANRSAPTAVTPKRPDAPAAAAGKETQRGQDRSPAQESRASSVPAPNRPQATPPPQASQRRPETAAPQARTLPGEAATRVAPNRMDNGGVRTQRHEAPPVPQTRAPQVQGSSRGPGGSPPAAQQNSPRPAPQESGRGNPGANRPGTVPGHAPESGRPGPGQ